jgi:hypothetical protein
MLALTTAINPSQKVPAMGDGGVNSDAERHNQDFRSFLYKSL